MLSYSLGRGKSRGEAAVRQAIDEENPKEARRDERSSEWAGPDTPYKPGALASHQAASAENWESLNEPIAWRPSEEYIRPQPLAALPGSPRRRQRRRAHRPRERRPDVVLGRHRQRSGAGLAEALHPGDGYLARHPLDALVDRRRLQLRANALDKHASGTNAGKTALIWEGEDGAVRSFSYSELLALTNRDRQRAGEPGRRQGGPRRHLPADDPRGRRGDAGLRQARRDLHPHLLRLRRGGGGVAAEGQRREGRSSRRMASTGAARSCR